MIEFFVKRPVTTVMFVAVFVVLGVVAFFNLRIEKRPRVDFPIVTIYAVCPGATPEEIESSVVRKIEDAVAELSEVKKIRSRSYENFGYIFVEFLLTADVNVKFIEVKDKVEALSPDFPAELEKPVIAKFDPFVEPIMDLVLSSDTLDERQLYQLADGKLRDSMAAVAGVANVSLFGGRERQINIFLDPLLMRQHYVDIRDVCASIKAKNRNIPGGLVEKEGRSLVLRFTGEYDDLSQIAETMLVSRDGVTVRLSDIGRVEDGSKKVETLARYNGKNVVGLSLEKVSDGNAVDVSREVVRRLPDFRRLLPEGTSLEIAADTTQFIIDETWDTEISIFLGVILTVAVLYLFTGSMVSTIIASIVIPTSIVSAMFFVDLSGFTINLMTLLALATALGTLIANAIVIVENCLVHVDRGEDPITAAITGTKEVTVAVLASTGTNMVVFAPLAFMGDIVGQFMRSFGLTVIYVTVASLLVSFTLTPMMCGQLLGRKRGGCAAATKRGLLRGLTALVDRAIQWTIGEYRILFDLIFRFPKLTLVAVVLVLMSTKLVTPYIGNDFFPKTDEDKVMVDIEMPQGSTIDRSLAVTEAVERRLAEVPEARSLLSYIGKNGVERASIVMNLVPLAERQRGDLEIIQELVPFMAGIPDAVVSLRRAGTTSEESGDISIHVFGKDYKEMVLLSRVVKDKMEQTGYFRSISSSYTMPKREVCFVPNQELLVSNGIRDVEVGSVIRASVYGDNSNVFKEAGEEYPINIKLDDRYTEDVDDIRQIAIISRKGLTPIVDLGTLKEQTAFPMIRRYNKQRVIQLDGYLSKSTAGHVRGVLNEAFVSIPFGEGYGYRFTGNADHQDSSSREISKAFVLAVIMTYMLLAGIMNSCLYPVPIILSIVTSFVGVFYALFFLQSSINVASMLGMVMLVGLVVNNSILLLDAAMAKMDKGVDVIDALWQGVVERFKAIVMTSIAIVLGVLPQLWSISPVKSSMGIVMVGGMLASILFTFILTPIAFWYAHRLKSLFVNRSPH